MKKKKFRFNVKLELLELCSVPYVSGAFFAKMRLIDGGEFSNESKRVVVENHRVLWDHSVPFQCKMYAPVLTGILEPCLLRLSVRKDGSNGRVEKLGFVDLDLAEFSGAGPTERKCILSGYDQHRRQDNSIVKLRVSVSLLEGDPLFKRRPASRRPQSRGDVDPADCRAGSGSRGVDISEQCGSPTPLALPLQSPLAHRSAAPGSSGSGGAGVPMSSLATASSGAAVLGGPSMAESLSMSNLARSGEDSVPAVNVRDRCQTAVGERPRSETMWAATPPPPIITSTCAGAAAAAGMPAPLSFSDTLPRTGRRHSSNAEAVLRSHRRNFSWDPHIMPPDAEGVGNGDAHVQGERLESISVSMSMASRRHAPSQQATRVLDTRFDPNDIIDSIMKGSSSTSQDGEDQRERPDPSLQLFVDKGGRTVVSGRSSGRHLDRYIPVRFGGTS